MPSACTHITKNACEKAGNFREDGGKPAGRKGEVFTPPIQSYIIDYQRKSLPVFPQKRFVDIAAPPCIIFKP